MLSVFFTDEPVHDFTAAKATETWRFPPFFHALLAAGVYPPCSAFETWFVSSVLDDAAFEHIADALPDAAWDLCDLAPYAQMWRQRHGVWEINVWTARGCPYRCNWCAKPVWGRSFSCPT